MASDLFWSPRNSSVTFVPRGKRPQYVHPYEDMASAAMPTTMQDALRWAEFIVSTTGPYRSALWRVAAYCVTDPEIMEANGNTESIGKEVRENYEKVLSDEFLKIKSEVLTLGMDLLTYGNAFVSVFSKFTRYLTCPGRRPDGSNCAVQIPLHQMLENPAYKFQFTNMEFHATCPYCGYRGKWRVYDQPSKSMEDLYIRHWDPNEMKILYDPFSNRNKVVWEINPEYAAQIRKGVHHVLESAPMEIIEAIKESGDFEFNDDSILHLKTQSLSGIKLRGWGMPSAISDFRQAWLYQTCNRHTETTAMESLAPMRIITPPGSPGQGDPVHTTGGPLFVQMAKRAIQEKRRDPSAWFVAPFPVQYQAVGGDASQFIPRDLLDYSLDALLTSAGVPVELYKGSLTIQAAPVALRLFTSYWQWLVTDYNEFLRFVVKKVSEILGWEPVGARFARITEADDINRQVQALQLMQTGAVSQTTGLASVGIDKHEEVRRIMEEQRDEAEQQEKMQEDLETSKQLSDITGGGMLGMLGRQQAAQQQQQQQGAGPMGAPGTGMPMPGPAGPVGMAGAQVPGAPGGGGMSSLMPGADPISQLIAQSGIQPTDSIQDIYAKAQTLAQQFMAGGNTASALRKLKQQDPQMHTIVKGIIEQMRSNASSQGRDMVLQQEFGG